MTAYFLSPPHRTLAVGPHRVASWTVGRGPDLLFVHGWPLHAATFRHVVERLAGDFTCHLIDLPGAGQTETPPDVPISLVGNADVVRGAATELGLARYGLVAHDSGGFVARHAAARDPRVTALVLGNTELPGFVPWQLPVLVGTLGWSGGGAVLRATLSSRALRRSALGFGTCFVDMAYLDGEFHQLFVEPLLRSRQAARNQVRAFATFSMRDVRGIASVHREIRAPVRLVWGARDTFFPLRHARAMLEQFGGGVDLREIPDGKLFAHEDRPEAFAEHARPFLLEHTGRA